MQSFKNWEVVRTAARLAEGQDELVERLASPRLRYGEDLFNDACVRGCFATALHGSRAATRKTYVVLRAAHRRAMLCIPRSAKSAATLPRTYAGTPAVRSASA